MNKASKDNLELQEKEGGLVALVPPVNQENAERLVKQADKVLLDLLVSRDCKEPAVEMVRLAAQAPKDVRERVVRMDDLEKLDALAHLVCKVHAVRQVKQVREVQLDKLEPLEKPDKEVRTFHMRKIYLDSHVNEYNEKHEKRRKRVVMDCIEQIKI